VIVGAENEATGVGLNYSKTPRSRPGKFIRDVITNDQSALLTDFKSPYIPPKNWRLAPRKVNGRKIIPSVEKPRRFSLRPASIPLKAIENGKKYGIPSAPPGDQYYDEPEDDNGAS